MIQIFFPTIAGAIIAENGVADLRGINPEKSKIISLDGEWNIYWDQVIREFIRNEMPTGHSQVPGPWILSRKNVEENITFKGKATYQLKVILPDHGSTIHLYRPYNFMAQSEYHIFDENGSKIYEDLPTIFPPGRERSTFNKNSDIITIHFGESKVIFIQMIVSSSAYGAMPGGMLVPQRISYKKDYLENKKI